MVMMVSQRTSLAVLIVASFILESTSAASSFRRQVRRHRGRGGQRRHRLGREKLEEVTTTSTTTTSLPIVGLSGPERYDLTSYGDYDAPSVKYGAPGPDDYTDDGYTGDVPGAVLAVGDDADYNTNVIAAAASDNDDDRDDGVGNNNEKSSELLPPWCNPTDPMGAWLNYENIQVE